MTIRARGFRKPSQWAKESSLDQLLEILSPDGWVPRWWCQELLVSPPGFLILPVFGLGCVKVHHAAVQRFPGTLVGPWTLQELPLQNLLKT